MIAAKMEKEACEYLDNRIKILSEKVKHYSQQSLRHERAESYSEPTIVSYLSTLYSTKPYNTDELKSLLKEYGMSDELSQKILSEVERRIANQEAISKNPSCPASKK